MNTHQIHPHSPVVGETRTEQSPQLAVDASRGPFLTTRQAADLIAFTPHRLAALRMTGRGPSHYRTPDGSAIYYRDDVLAWAATTSTANQTHREMPRRSGGTLAVADGRRGIEHRRPLRSAPAVAKPSRELGR